MSKVPPPSRIGPRKISIAIIDECRLGRETLAGLLGKQPEFAVCVAADDANEAMGAIRQAKPEVVLLDGSPGASDTAKVMADIREEAPGARIVVMGLSPLRARLTELVASGGAGFLVEDSPFEQYATTIRAVAVGATVFPPTLTQGLFDDITLGAVPKRPPMALSRLTRRERDIVDLISLQGLNNKDIARRLGVALHTVKSHVHNALRKLELNSRLELAAVTRTG
jgi:DNA-binding NarL/FixJ family response regulator